MVCLPERMLSCIISAAAADALFFGLRQIRNVRFALGEPSEDISSAESPVRVSANRFAFPSVADDKINCGYPS